MVLVPTILGFLLAIGKAFAQLQNKDKTGRLVNLCRKAKCADGLSRETLNASRQDTVNVKVTADWVESAGTLLRATTSKTVSGTVRRRLNSYLLGTVLSAGARYLVGHRRKVGLATARRHSNHRATVLRGSKSRFPTWIKGSSLGSMSGSEETSVRSGGVASRLQSRTVPRRGTATKDESRAPCRAVRGCFRRRFSRRLYRHRVSALSL